MYRNLTRAMLALGFMAAFGGRLQASTWFFQDTVLQGTFSGQATVTGFITLNGVNFGLPDSITLTGPFGQLTDPGFNLQLDEGDGSYADQYVDFLLVHPLATPGLTVDPFSSFTFTSVFAGSTVTDTYSLVTGELVLTPEPGTAPAMLGALVLGGIAARRRQRTNV
jgi:MYXO-CTERM domain-containing protein